MREIDKKFIMLYNASMNQRSQFMRKMTIAVALYLLSSPLTLFAYEAAPLSSTLAPTDITEQSARVNGKVNPSDSTDTMEWFEWGISGRGGIEAYETRHTSVYGGNTMVNTGETLQGLAPNTQYFYRQISENTRGKDTGQTVYFTTKILRTAVIPIALIETLDATYVNESEGLMRAFMSPHGNPSALYWFEWGSSIRFENQTPQRTLGYSSSLVSEKLTHLDSGTTYYYRAVADSGDGRFTGAVKVFHTRGNPPPPLESQHAQTISTTQSYDNTGRAITTNGTQAAAGGGGGNSFALPTPIR